MGKRVEGVRERGERENNGWGKGKYGGGREWGGWGEGRRGSLFERERGRRGGGGK